MITSQMLFWAELLELAPNLKTSETVYRWVRTPTGAFSPGNAGEPFLPLSGVIWISLSCLGCDSLRRAYKLYRNPNANNPLPDGVRTSLERIIEEWTTMEEEN